MPLGFKRRMGRRFGCAGGISEARGERRVRAALLGGSVLLPLYGVGYVDLLSPPGTPLPETRYVALGASFLNGSTVPGWGEGSGRETKEQQRNYFASYRNRTPEASLAQFIFTASVGEVDRNSRAALPSCGVPVRHRRCLKAVRTGLTYVRFKNLSHHGNNNRRP